MSTPNEFEKAMQDYKKKLSSKILILKAAKEALLELKELCEEGEITEGVYEDLAPTAEKLEEIIVGTEVTIDNILA